MSRSSGEFSPGDSLGEFRIVRAIGRGGMGSVYLAEDTRLGRNVALKVILPEFADQSDFRRRFEAEARGAAAIEHPSLVTVYAAGLLEGRLYMAMRFVDGENLHQAVDSHGPLDSQRAASILSRVASALDAAHAVGLVHRDVTPANILLEGERGSEGVYLTDFGLVRGLESGETRLTHTHQVIANLDYAAPEQIQGGRVDARTDVYALGCVLYWMCSGSRPFPGTDTQKMWKIVNEPLPSLGGGEPLDAVIARATDKDPDRRFPSAGDLSRAAAEPHTAVTRRIPERSVAIGPAAVGYVEGSEGAWDEEMVARDPDGLETRMLHQRDASSSRRRPLVLAIAAAALLAVGALAAILIGSGGSESPKVVRETVTATTEAAATVDEGDEGGGESEPEAEASVEPPGAGSGSSAPLPGLEAFEGIAYSGLAPVGWEHELVDKPVSNYYENVWREPSDPESTFVRVDAGNPVEGESPMAISEPLVEEVRQVSGYREISYEPDFKEGREAARWIFELDGDKRADYFFVTCGVGVASVGSTSPDRYPELAPMFREVAFSMMPHCE